MYLHGLNVIHGDLKAANILLDEDLWPYIADLGLSKDSEYDVTSSGLKGYGSGRWMAPELLLGGSKSLASDIYAFAMLFVEVCRSD